MHQHNQSLTINVLAELLGYNCDPSQIRTDLDANLAELIGASPPDSAMGNAASDGPRNGVKYSAAHQNRQDIYSIECEDLLGETGSALDIPLTISHFANLKAQSVNPTGTTVRELGNLIRETHASAKRDLPLLKMATFGSEATISGSLRHDSNLLAVSGIEGDYDGGRVTPETAAEMLRTANIAGLIYTTPSHTPDAPRWRVLCPASCDVSPAERNDLCARVNGVLGGILEPESFTLSQSYYYGTTGDAKCNVYEVDGRAIDKAEGLPRIGKNKTTEQLVFEDLLGEASEPDVDPTGLLGCDWFKQEPDWASIRSALSSIKDARKRNTWFEIGAALHHESAASEKGFKLWCKWSKQNPENTMNATSGGPGNHLDKRLVMLSESAHSTIMQK